MGAVHRVHTAARCSFSIRVVLGLLEENEGGAQEIAADPLCFPLPVMLTHTCVCVCVCACPCVCVCVCSTCPLHIGGFSCAPDACSLNCPHTAHCSDLPPLKHTHTHTHTALLVVFPLPSEPFLIMKTQWEAAAAASARANSAEHK